MKKNPMTSGVLASVLVGLLSLGLTPFLRGADRFALKSFYPANRSVSFPTTGTGPKATAFDGQNVWVVNSGDGTLTVLRANDGTLMCAVGVGGNLAGIAYDGAFMWVADSSGNQVASVQANSCDPDAADEGTSPAVSYFPLPSGASGPSGVAFDGVAIWVANSTTNNVTRLMVTNGVVTAAQNFTSPGISTPTALGYDGKHIWIANSTASSTTVLNANGAIPAAGTLFCQKALASPPAAFAFDGVNSMWTAYANAGGFIVRVFNSPGCPASNGIPTGNNATESDILFDGNDVWVSFSVSGPSAVVKLVPGGAAGATPVGTFPLPGGVMGLAFDGANLWATQFSAGAFLNGLISKL